jgi:hypothetical protein
VRPFVLPRFVQSCASAGPEIIQPFTCSASLCPAGYVGAGGACVGFDDDKHLTAASMDSNASAWRCTAIKPASPKPSGVVGHYYCVTPLAPPTSRPIASTHTGALPSHTLSRISAQQLLSIARLANGPPHASAAALRDYTEAMDKGGCV